MPILRTRRIETRSISINTMKIKCFVLVTLFLCAAATAFAQIDTMPASVQRTLKTKFQSWEVSTVGNDILEYYKREKSTDFPNAIKGDWNGDGKMDYAFQLQSRTEKDKKILVALMASGKAYKSHLIGEGYDCIMSGKKGSEGYDHEKQRGFRFKNDGIVSMIWEKSGTTYFWRKGRFQGVLTSD